VSNILDQKDPIALSYAAYQVGGVSTNPKFFAPNAYRFNDPRMAILSATLTF
jgi:hypothetical protein